MNIANAAPKPYGNGKTSCNPILTANDAKRNIRYDLKLIKMHSLVVN